MPGRGGSSRNGAASTPCHTTDQVDLVGLRRIAPGGQRDSPFDDPPVALHDRGGLGLEALEFGLPIPMHEQQRDQGDWRLHLPRLWHLGSLAPAPKAMQRRRRNDRG